MPWRGIFSKTPVNFHIITIDNFRISIAVTGRRFVMSKTAPVLIFALVIASLSGKSQTLSEPVFFNNHYYAATLECMTWPQADNFANRQTFRDQQTGFLLGGHLVTITTPEEQYFVHHTFVGNEWTHAWIGANRTSDEGGPKANWVWVTGEPWVYTNWAPDEPDRIDEHYGSLMNWTGGTWHDYGDGYYECGWRYTVVEFEPPLFRCAGFEPPVFNGLVRVAANRAIPLKMQLLDRSGERMKAEAIKNPPVFEVSYLPAAGRGDGETMSVVGTGRFEYTGNQWMYSLRINDCCALPGTYRVVAASGNLAEYGIVSECEAVFEIAK